MNPILKTVSLCGIAALVAACDNGGETARQEAPDSVATPADLVDSPDITTAELGTMIRTLGSDAFEGRAPATAGEEKTVAWLIENYKAVGLAPGNGDSFTQDVPLVTMTADPQQATMTVKADGQDPATYTYRDDMVTWTKRVVPEVAVTDSEMVFVGYGIVAPEYDWNDYADVDVTGKTVVILVNDPGFATGKPDLFNGKAMTYYGRYTYKYEEAARQGAAAAIIIHETAPAAYPWEVVRTSWTGPQFDLVRPDGNAGRVAIEGWVQNYVAEDLLAGGGLTLEEAHALALSEDFTAVPLNRMVSFSLTNSVNEIVSQNVIGKIEGATRPDEAVLYMAHWDHLGVGEPVDGDAIYNGTLDNATGTAGLIELAEKFKAQQQAPDRTVLFLAVTAEEFGLLGSAHYAENPVFPLAKTAGAINMDGANIWGPVSDITIIGYGQNEMQDLLIEAAGARNRTVDAEPEPEKGYFYRSDHFNLAKKGVPVLYTDTGVTPVSGDPDAMTAGREAYVANDYHQPSDEWSDTWDLTGAVDDLELFFDVGYRLATTPQWPAWYPGSEFKAAREANGPKGDSDARQ